MHDEVLETDGFPGDRLRVLPRFRPARPGEGQYWVALNGELTLHGVTRSQPVSARVSVNGDTLRAAGRFLRPPERLRDSTGFRGWAEP